MANRTKQKGIRSAAPVSDIIQIRDVKSPLVHSISVSWGDCDPAQIAYTANIPRWNLDALNAWYKACLGIDWYEINLDHGIGTPFVSLNIDFSAPITPRSALDCTVYVERLGNKSLSHRVEAKQFNELCFTGETTSAFVDASTFKSIEIPPNMRQSIQNYVSGQR